MSAAFFHLAGADTSDEIEAHRTRHRAAARARTQRDPAQRRAVRARRGAASGARASRPRRRGGAARSSAGALAFTRAGAGLDAEKKRGWPRSASGWRRSAPRSARTCSPTRRRSRSCSTAATISPACRRASSPPRRRRPPSAAIPASMWSRCRARRSSRSCNSRPGAICARRPGAPSSRAAPRRRARQCARSCARRVRAARRAARAARLCELRRLPPRRHDGQDAGAALDLMRRVWAPARAQALREAEALAGDDRRRGRQFRAAAWDWRYYAEKRRKALYDFDESELQALSAARSDDRRRLRRRPSPVRRLLRRARRRRSAASGRARLGGARTPTARRSRCSSATISRGPPSTAAPGCARCATSSKLDGARPADRRQRDELRARRRGRAVPAQPRRGAHPVPRIRPRPARHAVGRDLSATLRHQCRARLRRTALAALRALAGPAGDAAPFRPPSSNRRSRCPRR